jgi:hypothetical protein
VEEEKVGMQQVENTEKDKTQKHTLEKLGCILCGVYDSSKTFSRVSCCKAYVHTECFKSAS